MAKTCGVALLLLLTACASVAPPTNGASPCAISEASYECQIVRYANAP